MALLKCYSFTSNSFKILSFVIQCKNVKFRCREISTPQNLEILIQQKFHVLQ